MPIAEEFSPRYEQHGDDLIVLDISGLDRLLGTPRAIGEQIRREAMARGVRAHVVTARTRVTAILLAWVHPALTVVDAGQEAAMLAPLPVRVLRQAVLHGLLSSRSVRPDAVRGDRSVRLRPDDSVQAALAAIEHWGVRTLGELAALPGGELSARLGARGTAWQAIARGVDPGPLVPSRADERFEASLELEWPIEGLEPLSFVLTRLLEPLSTRLEQRDRGVAVLHIALRLVSLKASTEGPDIHRSRLELPTPMRDVRSLRTLALLDLEARPPSAAVEEVVITIEPTPGRILQHTLFTRPHPTPEQLSTLLARLGAVLGNGRVGAALPVDSNRPGAFAMKAFPIEHASRMVTRSTFTAGTPRTTGTTNTGPAGEVPASQAAYGAHPLGPISGALRRWRPPVPARVAVGADQRPVRIATDRPGIHGGPVVSCAGPWRTSGAWWEEAGRVGQAAQAGGTGEARQVERAPQTRRAQAGAGAWDRDEWDVAIAEGTVYRIFRDRSTNAWFIDALLD